MSGGAPASVTRLRIERRGGLAGLHASAERSVDALTPAERRALDALVKQGSSAAPSPGADRYTYRVTLGLADGSERVLTLGEDALPAALQALVKPTLP